MGNYSSIVMSDSMMLNFNAPDTQSANSGNTQHGTTHKKKIKKRDAPPGTSNNPSNTTPLSGASGGDVSIDVTPVIDSSQPSTQPPTQPSNTTTSATMDDASEALLPTQMYKEPNCMERCCCGSLANMACGYPSGTIRATIAVIFSIIFACACTFLVVYFAIQGKDNVSIASAGLLSTVLSGITGYYFGTRSEPKPSDGDRILRRV